MLNFLDILFWAALAGFLAFKLYMQLGRKDENEDSFQPLKRYLHEVSRNPLKEPITVNQESMSQAEIEENLPVIRSTHLPQKIISILMTIHQKEPTFTEEYFIQGAKKAFEMVIQAFTAGDTHTLSRLLSPEVLHDFTQEIETRREKGITLATTLIAVETAEIIDAEMVGDMSRIKVRFISEQINLLKDKEGKIVAGDAARIDRLEDTWIFAHQLGSPNPNWMIVGTEESASN